MGTIANEMNKLQVDTGKATMKAIMKHRAEPGAELREVPVPQIAPHEVLIEVKAASICGTDVHIYTWDPWAESRIKTPMVFGHEFAGVVVEVGSMVTGVQVGDYVSAETHVVCHQCLQCLTGQYHVCQNTRILGVDFQGCFAEYVKIPAENVWKNPADMPYEVASVQEPMGNAVHTVLAGPIAGKTVAIVGCGPIGLLAVAVAKASGATEVVALDVNAYRLDLARKVGATVTINSLDEDPVKKVMQVTGGMGVEVVCEMSGHPVAIRQALEMLTNGGRMSILSLPSRPVEVDLTNQVVFKGVTVQGITGRRIFETWRQTSGFLHSGQVDVQPLITHTLPLERFAEGFELMTSGQCGKVVLLP
ncbi:L-threonine 3-dehydrogenase [Brevibacillus humidisoli]|uniref:L-threonine 3-dehydrogenase n=1 Tax=Brevibacillus humidisoli TaxID=2895522 RepID=UPI001E537195|nr:L-threonine 3-dehydrogenase [Brevibacillus humidisoli]UFJ42219.1 L-threonine 3-dehydrogenase [Brevibacillus humidisoli]